MKRIPLLYALAAFALSTAASTSAATIYCNQVGGNYPGIYSFPSEGGTLSQVYAYNSLDSKYGSVFTPTAFYSVQYPNSQWQKPYAVRALHNAEMGDWQTPRRINEKLEVTDVPTTLALNPITGKIYGCFMNADKETYSFGTFTEADGTSEIIAPLPQQLVSIAADETGTMYAVGVDGKLYSLTSAGAMTEIGATGVTPSPKYSAGTAFDNTTGTLYWTVTTKSLDTSLYTINLTTGAATKVYDFPESINITALCILDQPAPAGAPADVTDFMAIPDGFQNKIDISFTLPSKTIAGNDMLGAVKYKVMVDDRVIANTQGGPGQAVSLSDTPGNGSHVVTLFTSNNAGKGNRAVARTYVGEDSPGAVTGLAISAEGRQITIAWEAPVVGQHGGLFNTEALVYDVVRVNDNVIVSEGQTGLSFTETVEGDGLVKYSYTVTPRCGELVGEPATTPDILVGDGMTPPYEQTFDAETFDEIYFSAYDANNDGYGWVVYQNYYGTAGNARYKYSPTSAADDWLFTCPLSLQAFNKYDVEFQLKCGSWGNGETLGVFYGTTPEPSAMTETLVADTDYAAGFNNTVTAELNCLTAGTYYIGFHITSAADSYDVDLDNIKISAGVVTGVNDVTMSGLTVSACRGGIRVYAEQPARIRIADLSGRIIADRRVDTGMTTIDLPAGIYIATAGDTRAKLLVR